MSATISNLRRRRGVVRGSITRIKSKVAELKDRKDTVDVSTVAIIDALESEEEQTREQTTFDEVDDEIIQLQVDIGALASIPTSSPGPIIVKEKRKVLHRKLAHIKGKFELILRTVDSDESKLDGHTLTEYSEELSRHKGDLSDTYDEILALDVEESDEICKTHSYLEHMLFDLSRKVNSKRTDIGDSAEDTAPVATAIKHPIEGVRLPKLEVPKFNGDILQWKVFWEQFNVSIHSRSSLSKSEKLVYLQQSLKEGSAKGIVEGLSRTGDCYDEAIESLKARYDRPRLIHQTHVKGIVDAPALKSGTGKELRQLHDTVQQHLRALKAMGYDPSGAFITSVLELKLDASTMFEWQRHSQREADVPHFRDLLEFVNLRAQASESVMDYSQKKQKSESHKGSGMNSSKHIPSYTTTIHKPSDNCAACKCDKHPLYACTKFKALPHSDKMSLLKSNSLCLNCLRPGHYANQCKSVNRCRTCQRPHHSLLHLESMSETTSTVPNHPHNSSDSVTSHTATELNSGVLLMTCKVLIEAPDGNNFEIRGILDSASSASFVTERIVQTLKLPRSHYSAKVSGIAGLSCPSNNQSITTFNISPVRFPKQQMSVSAIVTPRITCNLPTSPVMPTRQWHHLTNLPLADLTYGTPGRIDILLGVDVFTSVLLQGRRSGPVGTPTAIKTKFGWVLAGSTKSVDTPCSVVTCFSVTENTDDLLHRFWEVEKCGSHQDRSAAYSGLSVEERHVLKHFQDNHTRTDSGRFIVPLPRKVGCLPLGESRSRAVKRFLSLERSLKSQEQREGFHSVMEEYFQMGHAEIVPQQDLEKQPKDVFYLPMHVVHKDSSTTTKLRIVFDASAKTSSNVSLNDTLMVGHTVHPTLIDVLLRFRAHRVALVADISKMYRAVELANSDKDLHRFVWRRSSDEQLKDYRMTRLTFGVSASSFAANMSVTQNALDLEEEYPLAAEAVYTSFYVDDALTGADSVEDAITLVKQLHEMFTRAGFLLRKWNSSNTFALEELPDELKSTEVSHIVSDIDNDQYTKTLGIEWNSVMDHFRLSVAKFPPIVNLTKRALVSDIAKTYDILGWFSPTIITMKILLQRTWKKGIGWDDVIPDDIREGWFRWRSELDCLTEKHIPRCYFPKGDKIIHNQLHGFSDASENAYAAVVYLRSTNTRGNSHLSLIIAKTKVAPIKRLTIPRLELCGAQLLAQLLHHLRVLFNIPYSSVYAWTDSTIVLNWLTGNPRRFKTFVGNRVSDILDHIAPDRWNHVSGSSNPADCASRGLLPSELLHHDLWWDGPKWLMDDPDEWLKSSFHVTNIDSENEEKGVCLITLIDSHPPVLAIDRYSSFSRYIRITGWIQRFIYNCGTSVNNRSTQSFLSVHELQSAENYWFQMIQREYFLTEINNMKQGKSLSHSSTLLSLCPMLDKNGIVRIGGRQRNSQEPYESIHPIILHGKHRITRLIIMREHLQLMHGGPTLVHGSISQRFHIIGGHKVIRTVIRKCIICRKHSAKPQTQIMGDLPAKRVRPDHPFNNVGVDYAGPFYTKRGHTRKPTINKSYVCVFVAFSVKAVHLEVVSDLTSEAFLAALRRFVARRGKPSIITSDNGTNFVRADKDLIEFYNFLQDQIVQRNISEFCTSNGIKWKFIPERAPHFGGLWESAVKSMKYHLKRVIGDAKLTFEELTTLLTQVEACLNSRPLTPLSANEEGIEILTPGHFLIGRPLEAIPDSTESYSPLPQLRRWHLVQNLNRQFWERWSSEYLVTIRKMTKWHFPSRNIQANDIVLLKEDGLVPLKWPMARVMTTYKGKDNRVRVATIKTSHGIYKRPITKLALILPTDEDRIEHIEDKDKTISLGRRNVEGSPSPILH